ncbi:MAG TPA: helical backbone metal receptor [Gemmatimonadaceae bacterium]|nr:helical backbone metal receptor [Gemmatimonadaceae bacterium]
MFPFLRRPLLRPLTCAALALALALACGATACREPRSDTPSDARATHVPRDDWGNPVLAGTTRVPARIVSLNPASTEILFALGAGSRLVGRTHWDVWPPQAVAVPDLGPGLRPNVEAVLAAHPDLVVLYASEDNRAAAARLSAAGIHVIALRFDRISGFDSATTLLGRAVGLSDAARVITDSVRRTLAHVRASTDSLSRRTVFWHVWDAPLITIGAGSFLDDLVRIAGGRNVYGDLQPASPVVSLEDVARRDPDVILAGPEGAARIRSDPAWRAVRAVQRDDVLVVDTTLVGRPSVRLGEAAVSLARLLHPGWSP